MRDIEVFVTSSMGFGVGIIILSGVTSYLYIHTDILDVYF